MLYSYYNQFERYRSPLVLINAENLCYLEKICYPPIQIAKRRTTFIRGESGCGKSSLLRILSGIITPDSGQITYLGKPIESYDPVVLRREILLCGQTVFLFPGTIESNYHQFYGFRDSDPPLMERIADFLEVCCLDFRPDAAVDDMSGGERQRAFLSICLSFTPTILMLDEPTSALDEFTADRLMDSVTGFCEEHGITLIIICHDHRLAERYGDAFYDLSPVGATPGKGAGV